MGLPFIQYYIIAIIGNMIPVPFIYFFARKILVWGGDKPVVGNFFTWCLEKGEKGGKKLQATAGKGLFVALLIFVGIPLPGTGAWTGTLAASILDMNFKSSVLVCYVRCHFSRYHHGSYEYGIVWSTWSTILIVLFFYIKEKRFDFFKPYLNILCLKK